MFICGIRPMLNLLLCLHIYPEECHQLLPTVLYSDKVIKDTDMNVWKYTYIKFYQFRRETLAGDYTAMLFVVELDFCVYSGIVFLIDGLTGYNLIPCYGLLYVLILLGGGFILWMIRNHSLRKNGAFERIKKEVEEEPRKFLWGTLSLLFVLFTLAFVALSMYLWSQKMIPVLVSL